MALHRWVLCCKDAMSQLVVVEPDLLLGLQIWSEHKQKRVPLRTAAYIDSVGQVIQNATALGFG